jgi:hypothetical protein
MVDCLRCGNCCLDCPQLIHHKTKTSCRIYGSRIGFKWFSKLAKQTLTCSSDREKWLFKDCPAEN